MDGTDTTYDSWDFSGGITSGSIPAINSPVYNTGGYSPSIPTADSNVNLWGGLKGTISDLLNYSLQRDRLSSQVELAKAQRQIYPYGTQNLMPGQAIAGSQLINLVMIGAVILVGLKLAKVV